MSIPALGGGANQAMQRALMDAAERALADELGILDGEDPAAATSGAANGAAATAGRTVRRQAAGAGAEPTAAQSDEAIVVELGESDHADRLEVAGGWITTAKRGPLETKGAPEAKHFAGADVKGGTEAGSTAAAKAGPGTAAAGGARPGRAADGQITAQPGQQAQPSVPAGSPNPAVGTSGIPAAGPGTGPGAAVEGTAGEAPQGTSAAAGGAGNAPAQQTAQQQDQRPVITLDRLIVVLKKTGIGFRDAYQVLREIHTDEPLPPRAELRARWTAADPAAWEEHARESTQAAGQSPARATDADLRQTAVDDLIRDRTWQRAHAATEAESAARASGSAGSTAAAERDDRPTLQSIVRQDAVNQTYVAGLSTAEFQRLVTILGRNAPEWFWDLRGHRGLRGFAERPVIAKLNTTRIAGTRLGAWILAMLGMAMLWYIGLHTGVWW